MTPARRPQDRALRAASSTLPEKTPWSSPARRRRELQTGGPKHSQSGRAAGRRSHVYDILRRRLLILTRAAVQAIEARFARGGRVMALNRVTMTSSSRR